MDINSETVGIVVPTLGQRGDLLEITLKSIRASNNVFIAIVCPDTAVLEDLADLFDDRITDPGTGLSDAINKAFSELPKRIELINWLGDDDFLEPNSIDIAREALIRDTSIVAVFGKCAYVDHLGRELFINHSGRWAVPLLHFGPQLIPQPGMLFRRTIFNKIGGLSNNFGWAFDFDLLLNLKKFGKLKYVDSKLASFRWHPGSLSVGQRKNSVREASRVRVSHLPKYIRPLSFIWEKPVMYATLKTGQKLSSRLQKD